MVVFMVHQAVNSKVKWDGESSKGICDKAKIIFAKPLSEVIKINYVQKASYIISFEVRSWINF